MMMNEEVDDESSRPWSYYLDEYPFPQKRMTRIMSIKNKVEYHIKNKIKIPDEYRSKIWYLMEKLDTFTDCEKNKNVFTDCFNTKNEDIENDVQTDAVRTCPSAQYKIKLKNKQSNSKDSLFKVLKAYAIYNEEVQYTQGMNYLCLILLCYFLEEESFWMMDILIKKHGMRHFFRKTKTFLPSYLTIFERELEYQLPELSNQFKKEGIQVYMFIQGWWSTIFVYILPVESVPVIWDYFFWGANGTGVEVLFRLSIALLKMLESTLLTANLTEFFERVKTASAELDTVELIYQAHNVELTATTDSLLREILTKEHQLLGDSTTNGGEPIDDNPFNAFDSQKLTSLILKVNQQILLDNSGDPEYERHYSSGSVGYTKTPHNSGRYATSSKTTNIAPPPKEKVIDYDILYYQQLVGVDHDDEDDKSHQSSSSSYLSSCVIS
ncbi:hypothetical protein CYY_008007 [Polysphondylium violaceum]|uniref:Rab-GAP TBC domain-containing protein n=1 Tax=Polysphondylium violaceum TaxID=133409 RepID=A0A8J4UQH2_9MYCE|nr:hypothetical protein CYY_008007 [Polysphondylium violaceum]